MQIEHHDVGWTISITTEVFCRLLEDNILTFSIPVSNSWLVEIINPPLINGCTWLVLIMITNPLQITICQSLHFHTLVLGNRYKTVFVLHCVTSCLLLGSEMSKTYQWLVKAFVISECLVIWAPTWLRMCLHWEIPLTFVIVKNVIYVLEVICEVLFQLSTNSYLYVYLHP